MTTPNVPPPPNGPAWWYPFVDFAAKALLVLTLVGVALYYWQVTLGIAVAVLALGVVIGLVAGAVLVWPLSLLLAVVGGFMGGGAGAAAGAAIGGVVGAIIWANNRY